MVKLLVGASLFGTAVLFGALFADPAVAANVSSISRIAFGPDDTIFVADWKDAKVHALKLDPAAKDQGRQFNVMNLGAVLAGVVGEADPAIEDMAMRPGTDEAYVAVSVGPARTPAIIVVRSDGSAHALDLRTTRASEAPLELAPDDGLEFWDHIPERSFTVTDMKWRDGKLYVAGLSNQDFASALRVIPYPFQGKSAIASIEIYHASHDEIETRAPIRAMTFAELDGKPYLVAAYTCTPVVTIPLESLQDGAHLRGKTIGELGSRNTPSRMLFYTAKADGDRKGGRDGKDVRDGKPASYILLTNVHRGADLIPLNSIEEANRGPGLTTHVGRGDQPPEAIHALKSEYASTLGIDNQNDRLFVVLRRDLETGHSQLVSFDKQAGFRRTDIVEENNFPDYVYRTGDDPKLHVGDRLMREEGFQAYYSYAHGRRSSE
jgi:hypothetical protein